MSDLPEFLDRGRPDVPDLVVARAVLPFHLPHRAVRGRLVRLGVLADALLTRHDYPEPVARLAGEALALAAGLASALKFRGSFSVQARGDGPVRLLLADCTEHGALRGYARLNREALESLLATNPNPSAAALLGNGYLAFSVVQRAEREPYQGIVAIEGESLAEMAGAYFRASEQIKSLVRLAAARGEAGWRAGALILERIPLPRESGALRDIESEEESWRRATLLAETLTESELLDEGLAPERLLYRLFHAEGVSVAQPRALAFGCRCSRARLADILESFRPEELDEMRTEAGEIVMTCEFCNVDFRFARERLRGRTSR